jgi:hypothetical protein
MLVVEPLRTYNPAWPGSRLRTPRRGYARPPLNSTRTSTPLAFTCPAFFTSTFKCFSSRPRRVETVRNTGFPARSRVSRSVESLVALSARNALLRGAARQGETVVRIPIKSRRPKNLILPVRLAKAKSCVEKDVFQKIFRCCPSSRPLRVRVRIRTGAAIADELPARATCT